MGGFIAEISAELPGIEFVNGPDTVESHGFDADELYEESGEWAAAPSAPFCWWPQWERAGTRLGPAAPHLRSRSVVEGCAG